MTASLTPILPSKVPLLLSLTLFLFSSPPSTALGAEDWKVTQLAYDLQTAEGPVWDAEKQLLFFTEIFARKVHSYDPKTGKLKPIREASGGANGMSLDA